jgi:hypothetical protein
MAPSATVVPQEIPDQSEIIVATGPVNPLSSMWFEDRTITGVPEVVMGWLVAQGWRITGISSDATTVPPTKYYALAKAQLSPYQTLISLCNTYQLAALDAFNANTVRYGEVVQDWTEMLASTQTHFGTQITAQNADLGVYIADLGTYMDQIDTLTTANADNLASDYAIHKVLVRGLLTNLGSTEVTRINEQFAASLAVQLQGLTDRGLYSAGVAADITARNVRDRDEQLQKLYDALAREQTGNEHLLWNERAQLAEQNNRVITQMMETATRRLAGWRDVAEANQKLMAYQLDTRNQLLIGLYSFVERREDQGPEWKDMSQMVASIGDSGSAWISPQ